MEWHKSTQLDIGILMGVRILEGRGMHHGENTQTLGGERANPSNPNQNTAYVPPHQRGYQPNQNNHPNQFNHYSSTQNHLNPSPHFNSHYNPYHQQNPNHFLNQNKQAKSMEEMMGEMLSSQQTMQSNLQSNNEVVQSMQSAQKEHKANMDMLNKQLSQLANSMNKIRGNAGKLPATVHMPDKANVSKVTLKSGTSYKEPELKTYLGEPSGVKGTSNNLAQGSDQIRPGEAVLLEEVSKPIPRMEDPFFLDEEPQDVERGSEEECKEEGPGEVSRKNGGESKEVLKPFPYRFTGRRRKEDPIDYMSIFGKLEVHMPLLQALKLPPLGIFIKEFIAGKANGRGKIVMDENV